MFRATEIFKNLTELKPIDKFISLLFSLIYTVFHKKDPFLFS